MKRKIVTATTEIRTKERSHLLGLLRIRLMLLKNESVTTDDIFKSLDSWISSRESLINSEIN
ncbi:hypothetical protein AB4K05_21385 [Kluyvera sp. STS39-E]|uniref:hypothetical protein n=1 Tax=Kluyvera sp. STS39-E TaxID=3234748 RepID=UPI002072B320